MLSVVAGYCGLDESQIAPCSLFERDLGLSANRVIDLLSKVEDALQVELLEEAFISAHCINDIMEFLEEV
ncbi:MAG: hypothetical protein IJ184_06000 [Alphaproteobacteria bacterium]|nr:hypothetical protein [Alphaproteobacteria bacterium]